MHGILTRKKDILVTIINCYQVSNNKTKRKFTYAAQLEAQHRKKRNSIVDVRYHLIHDLNTFIGQLQREGLSVLMIGDFNQDVTNINSFISEFLSKKWFI